jgi:predicted permease
MKKPSIAPKGDVSARTTSVLVLSHDYWQRRFGGDRAVVGSQLTVSGKPYTVVGVTRAGFTGSEVGRATDFWVPMTMQAEFKRDRSLLSDASARWLFVIGRLRPGVTMATAEASVNLTLGQFLAANPSLALRIPRQEIRIGLQPGATGVSAARSTFREPLIVLMAGVGLLLVIVCLNVSHLMLARAIHRRREMSIRTALGATRARLVRQLLTEGLLLSVLGAAGAVLVTGWLSDGLLGLASRGGLPVALDVNVGARMGMFIAVLALAAALLLGLVPAWRASHIDLQQALRLAAQSVTSQRSLPGRLLLISQVAFSLVLLVGAGLLTGSLSRLHGVNKGFDDEHVLLVGFLPGEAGLDFDRTFAVYSEILRQVRALPGVRAASLSRESWPLSKARTIQTLIDPSRSRIRALVGVVTPGHFDAVGMTLARGRALTGQDQASAQSVAVINETLAGRLAGAGAPVGRRFRFDSESQEIEIVGVVKDAKTNGLGQAPWPMVYLPSAQKRQLLDGLEVRTTADPALLADQVRRIMRDVRPDLPVVRVTTTRGEVERSLVRERLLTTLASAFGLTALFLVCIGLYGVISQWAAQRTTEIGVRMALGATTAGVRWMVLRQTLILVITGVVIGLPAAVAAARSLESFLYGVGPMDPATLIFATLVMLGVATIAGYLPARRASRVAPMMALRCE